MKPCSKCGRLFAAPARGKYGRPRTRCDACRGSIDRIDGVRWRSLRRQVLADGPPCSYGGCQRPATQVDHIVPLSRGGDPYDLNNLQPLCGYHNGAKGNKMPGEVPRRTAVPNYRRLETFDPYEACGWHKDGAEQCRAAGHEPPPRPWML